MEMKKGFSIEIFFNRRKAGFQCNFFFCICICIFICVGVTSLYASAEWKIRRARRESSNGELDILPCGHEIPLMVVGRNGRLFQLGSSATWMLAGDRVGRVASDLGNQRRAHVSDIGVTRISVNGTGAGVGHCLELQQTAACRPLGPGLVSSWSANMAYVEARIWLAGEAGPCQTFLEAWQVPLFDSNFIGAKAGL